ncbi:MAG: hypothetical protein RJB66_296 [Pseudomonadota bacterium]|jgi:hypothetical protein
MIRQLNAIFFSLVFLAFHLAHAADVDALNRLFIANYWGSLYQANRCGQNAENFVRYAIREGINLQGTYLLQLENKGMTNFGLVAAVKAREQGRIISPNPPKGSPERDIGTANWGYHAFVAADGYVFDFDFENAPRATPFIDYIREMFVPPHKHGDPAYIRNRLAGYQLTFYPVKMMSSRDTSGMRGHELFNAPVSADLLQYLDGLQSNR